MILACAVGGPPADRSARCARRRAAPPRCLGRGGVAGPITSVAVLAEEDTVPLVGDLGKVDFLIATGGVEPVSASATAPRDVGVRLHEFHPERIGWVAEGTPLLGSRPSKVERNLTRRWRREVEQAIRNGAIVGNREVG